MQEEALLRFACGAIALRVLHLIVESDLTREHPAGALQLIKSVCLNCN